MPRDPQEEKDAYGFERETQDVLQALVESCDTKVAAEEAALKESGSTELIDKTSGFLFPRDATAEQIEALRSTKHHAACDGKRSPATHSLCAKASLIAWPSAAGSCSPSPAVTGRS